MHSKSTVHTTYMEFRRINFSTFIKLAFVLGSKKIVQNWQKCASLFFKFLTENYRKYQKCSHNMAVP